MPDKEGRKLASLTQANLYPMDRTSNFNQPAVLEMLEYPNNPDLHLF